MKKVNVKSATIKGFWYSPTLTDDAQNSIIQFQIIEEQSNFPNSSSLSRPEGNIVIRDNFVESCFLNW